MSVVALGPLAVLAVGALAVTTLVAARRHYRLVWVLTVIVLACALASAVYPFGSGEHAASTIILDDYTRFFWIAILGAAIGVATLSLPYLARYRENREEYYALLLLAVLGATVLAASRHFVSMFLGLELLSVSLYVLIAYTRDRVSALEAGFKYLILAATASAFLLFGMALLYAESGTMDLELLSAAIAASEPEPWRSLGLLALVTGIGFKLAVAPFHMWTPDVYQGAPAPVTAFVATVSKGGVLALLLRYFVLMEGYRYGALALVFGIMAFVSILAGNLLALQQQNVKRILAYSSIAHFGYVLVALLAAGPVAMEAVSFYFVTYALATLGAFGVMTVLSGPERDAEALEHYRGLFWRRPALALIFTMMLLSLAGIPLTAGFFGKFYVLLAGVQSALWVLALTLVVGSVVGLFYYLRIVVAMFSDEDGWEPAYRSASLASAVVLGALVFLNAWIGIRPDSLMRVLESLATGS